MHGSILAGTIPHPRTHPRGHSVTNLTDLPAKSRGGTPYNGLYGEATPERGTFFRLEVYKRVGISRVEV